MTRVCFPIFGAAISVVFAAVLFLVVMFAYGGDATAVAGFYLVVNLIQYALVVEAYKEGRRRA